jgi:hypothetical protein
MRQGFENVGRAIGPQPSIRRLLLADEQACW